MARWPGGFAGLARLYFVSLLCAVRPQQFDEVRVALQGGAVQRGLADRSFRALRSAPAAGSRLFSASTVPFGAAMIIWCGFYGLLFGWRRGIRGVRGGVGVAGFSIVLMSCSF